MITKNIPKKLKKIMAAGEKKRYKKLLSQAQQRRIFLNNNNNNVYHFILLLLKRVSKCQRITLMDDIYLPHSISGKMLYHNYIMVEFNWIYACTRVFVFVCVIQQSLENRKIRLSYTANCAWVDTVVYMKWKCRGIRWNVLFKTSNMISV